MEIAAHLLTGGNLSRLIRRAIDELIEKHADEIKAARPKYEALEAARAALRGPTQNPENGV